jgi:hypothetical protein
MKANQARTFAQAGAKLAIADLDDAGARLTVSQLQREGGQPIDGAVARGQSRLVHAVKV